ncbi:MAG: TatD family hydrolase [bacterium]|nr:TatD family hydrolase [bacterium]
MLIDSHAHIQFPAYDEDREVVILRSREAGVHPHTKDFGVGVKMIAVGTQVSTSEDAIRAAEQWPEDVVGATVGFHPNHLNAEWHHDKHELKEAEQETFYISKFRNIAAHSRVVAIGECGLDYYRIKEQEASIKEAQEKVFIQQIVLAHEVKKPLIIHCRSAFSDLISVLQATSYQLQARAGVIHFFSGTIDDARKLMDFGFYLGFGGVITFAKEYEEVIRFAPLDRILLETDAPYVAPVPYRGKRNEPAYMVETAKKLAELKGVSPEEVAHQTTQNAVFLFSLPS